jgi:hypothetical protein
MIDEMSSASGAEEEITNTGTDEESSSSGVLDDNIGDESVEDGGVILSIFEEVCLMPGVEEGTRTKDDEVALVSDAEDESSSTRIEEI